MGGQEQFYLEGHVAYAVPRDDGGMHVYTSTQHPTETQHHVAHALGLDEKDVVAECRRMGVALAARRAVPCCSLATPRCWPRRQAGR